MSKEARLAADLQECASWVVEAAEGQQVILQHTQRFLHMQPMQVHLRSTKSTLFQAERQGLHWRMAMRALGSSKEHFSSYNIADTVHA